jgi:hypothetical protein
LLINRILDLSENEPHCLDSEKRDKKRIKSHDNKEKGKLKLRLRQDLIDHFKSGSPLNSNAEEIQLAYAREDSDERYNYMPHKHPILPHVLLPADPTLENPNCVRNLISCVRQIGRLGGISLEYKEIDLETRLLISLASTENLFVNFFRCEEHLYTKLRWLVGLLVGPSVPTMRDYVEK